ncbi:hypothetical protein E4P32_20645 [Herbaspirillum sp. 3R11]|nr:hypothetical protein DZB54_15970 [Herbaspirillum sp. 3R-3a1]TFI05802.1 hypothetical protein E4P32_20645 [Herbaspirillum sp. 3R11]TFI13679.1 hypothetical protein E4P31_17950 [Herbaspirillum sp. 3R-11]TFI20467.1 hypothetical protein E4P30_22205 [Herbaspirillum sp. 3C11]
MSLDMNLEIEGGSPDWAALEKAAKAAGVVELTNSFPHPERKSGVTNFYKTEEQFDGWFLKSRTSFRLHKKASLGNISAEGVHGCDFKVQYVIVFRPPNSGYDEFVEEIRIFLSILADLSSMQFVLSFQYEGVYATHNATGFSFHWDKPK